MGEILPPMPLDDCRDTKNTVHLYCQIIGKIRMALHPKLNHWWHVSLYVTPRGLSTGTIPFGKSNYRIELDFVRHRLAIATGDGREEDFAIYDGLSVADCYSSLIANLAKLGLRPVINSIPYESPSKIPFAENTENCSYDFAFVRRFHETLVFADGVLTKFRGRFIGKSTPVHLFWHSFDLALTRFSGRRAPKMENVNRVKREAYSHELISFGFWFGDDKVPAPAFYSYTEPEPRQLTQEPFEPTMAKWIVYGSGLLALLMYDDVRQLADAEGSILNFLESAYRAGSKCAGWNSSELELE